MTQICLAQRKADFELTIYITDTLGHKDSVIIGYDANTDVGQADSSLGEDSFEEVNGLMLGHSFTNKDSFEVFIRYGRQSCKTKNIVQSISCGKYEFGIYTIVINAQTFPLIIKWDKLKFQEFCWGKTFFQPSMAGPLQGDYSEVYDMAIYDSVKFYRPQFPLLFPVISLSPIFGETVTGFPVNIQWESGTVPLFNEVKNMDVEILTLNNKIFLSGKSLSNSFVMINSLNGQQLLKMKLPEHTNQFEFDVRNIAKGVLALTIYNINSKLLKPVKILNQ